MESLNLKYLSLVLHIVPDFVQIVQNQCKSCVLLLHEAGKMILCVVVFDVFLCCFKCTNKVTLNIISLVINQHACNGS